MTIDIQPVLCGMIQENAYIVSARGRDDCVVVDPGDDYPKLKQAIDNRDFVGDEDGIPVLNYDNTAIMEVPVGLGPLHTQFDGKGYAYTSLFVESAVAKWKLPPYEPGVDPQSLVVEKIPVHFNIGHLVAMAKASVYEAKDAAGAKSVVDEFYDEVSPKAKPANPVRNMPDSRCMQLEDRSFYCLATADHYAIEAAGPNLLDAQQLTAAQYVMLLS